MDSEEQPDRARQRGGDLGRLAGKFVKNAGPRTRKFIEENRPRVDKAISDTRPKVEKAIADYRPRVEQAGRDAARYAQEHQDEIKGLAIRGARMRLGPFGMAIDALGLGGQQQQAATDEQAVSPQQVCPSCSAENLSNARFCSACGARLPDNAGA